jgi:hypothetical protein
MSGMLYCAVRYDKYFPYAVKKYRTRVSTLTTKFCGKIGFTLIKILTIQHYLPTKTFEKLPKLGLNREGS